MSERSPLVSSRSGTSSSSGYGGADEYEPSDDENVTNDIPGGLRYAFRIRNVFICISSIGFAIVYGMRVNMNVALVAMINNTAVGPPPVHTSTSCPDIGNSTDSKEDGPFDWGPKQQGFLISAFFLGYVMTQIPGGTYAEKKGGKNVFLTGMFITTIFTILTPWAAYQGFGVLLVARFIEGLGEGVTFPVMHAMLSKWAPPLSRSWMATFIYSGAQLGTCISLPITGILCDKYGWESVFYVFGSAGLLWCLLWFWLASNSPFEHRYISKWEKKLFEKEFGKREHAIKQSHVQTKFSLGLAREICKTVPFWAILVAHFAQNWGFYTLLNELPTFMKQVLHLTIKENGIFSALPYFGMLLVSLSGSCFADLIRKKRFLSTTATRKLFNSIAFLLPAACLVAAMFVGCNELWIKILLIMTVSLNGFNYAGFNCNHIDIASNYAGTLMGITNMVANLTGFLTPILINYIVGPTEDLLHWHVVFGIAAVLYVIGNTVFLIFGSGKEQPLNNYREHDDRDETVSDSTNDSLLGAAIT